MPDAVQVVANWVKKWQALVAVAIGLVGVGIVWGVDKADRKIIHSRLESVERRIERHDIDHETLIRIDENVKSMGERLKRIENK